MPMQTTTHWRDVVRTTALRGAAPALLSTAMLAAASRRRRQSPFAPTNAVSHWLWGDRAFLQDAPSLRYTLVGYATHHAASAFWAVIEDRLFGRRIAAMGPGRLLALSLGTSAFAALIDYTLTPPRLRPGYEHRLSRADLVAVHAAFGIGLAAGAWAMRDTPDDTRTDHDQDHP
jgi:hypothetical protein